MSKVRFRADTTNSFFGNFLYSQVLPKENFLVRLKNEVPWERFTRGMLSAYKGGGEYGPTPYAPDKILRMLLIPYLFNISEREAESVVRFNLLAKYFVGLGVDELSPDNSTLTVFKERLLKAQGQKAWEDLFNKIIVFAKKKGIVFGKLQIIDSTHTTANVNLEKEKERRAKGKSFQDPDASFKTKGLKERQTKEGKNIMVKDQVYGFKTHTSLNQKTNLITAISVTTAKEDDGKQFQTLVDKDEKMGVVKANETDMEKQTIYTADKAYDDGDNHEYLKERKLISAIILKETRIKKKDSHKEPWLAMIASPTYQESIRKRKQIEKKFGELKLHHGFDRCRYLGLKKYAIQAYLTTMVVNLKRLMLLTSLNNQVCLAKIPISLSPPGVYCV